MRICEKCGQKLPTDAKKCKYCGGETAEYVEPKKAPKNPTPKFNRCRVCGQILSIDAKKCKYCGGETAEYVEPKKAPKNPTPKFNRCRVCGQILSIDAKKCKYCGGGVYVDTDQKIKKIVGKMAKNVMNTDNTKKQYAECDRLRLLDIATKMGLNPYPATGYEKLAKKILAVDPTIVLTENSLVPVDAPEFDVRKNLVEISESLGIEFDPEISDKDLMTSIKEK